MMITIVKASLRFLGRLPSTLVKMKQTNQPTNQPAKQTTNWTITTTAKVEVKLVLCPSFHKTANTSMLKTRLWGSAEDLFLTSKYAALTGERI